MASQVRRSLVHAMKQIKSGFIRSYSTGSNFFFFFINGLVLNFHAKRAGLQPQLSPKLVKIMEQRLSLIEQRNACLHSIINQVPYLLACFLLLKYKFYLDLNEVAHIGWDEVSRIPQQKSMPGPIRSFAELAPPWTL